MNVHFIDEGDNYYRVDVNLESALYRMVRNIIGSSLHVATGQMSFEKLLYLLKEVHESNHYCFFNSIICFLCSFYSFYSFYFLFFIFYFLFSIFSFLFSIFFIYFFFCLCCIFCDAFFYRLMIINLLT